MNCFEISNMLTDWILLARNKECKGSDQANPKDKPEILCMPSIEECAVHCATKGYFVFSYARGKEDGKFIKSFLIIHIHISY